MQFFRKIIHYLCRPCAGNQSPTVRYAFPLIFTFATLLGAAAVIQSDDTSYIHIESSQTSLTSGEAFQIDVYVHAHTAINAVDIGLQFPKDQIKIEGIDTGQSVITLWAQEPYVEQNTVYLRGGTFRRGFRGDHRIATINARAIETGLAQITVNNALLLAGDGTGAQITVTKNSKDEATLFIDNEKEKFAEETQDGANLQGTASIVIVTDINGDGIVTLADVSRFMVAWASRSITYDFNNDGMMTFRDFGIILAHTFIR